MLVIGIVPSPSEIRWVLATGTRKKPEIVEQKLNKTGVPADGEEAAKLLELLRFFEGFFGETHVEKVVIRAAGNTEYGGPSPKRIKIEAVIQIAAEKKGIPVHLVRPNSMAAVEKQFLKTEGRTLEEIINSGANFKPAAIRDVVVTAWYGLDL